MRPYIVFALLTTVSATAFAQEAPYTHTLDAQMQRVQSGQSATPPWGGNKDNQVIQNSQPESVPAKAAEPAPQAVPEEKAPESGEELKPMTQPTSEVQPQSFHNMMPAAGINSQGGGAIPALPLEIHMADNIRYITGGVGEEEMAQLKMVEHEYNFRLLLTGVGGAYISDATVRITDSSGRLILSTDGAGPYLYATLAPGSYKLEITAPEGGIKTAAVKVPEKGFIKPAVRFTE